MVLRICKQLNLKLNTDKCLLRCTSIPLFGEVISCHGLSPDPRIAHALTDLLPLQSKKIKAVVFWHPHLLKFKLSPAMAEVY